MITFLRLLRKSVFVEITKRNKLILHSYEFNIHKINRIFYLPAFLLQILSYGNLKQVYLIL